MCVCVFLICQQDSNQSRWSILRNFVRLPTYLAHILIDTELGAGASLGRARVETGRAGVVGLGLFRRVLHLLPLHRLHLLPFFRRHFLFLLPFAFGFLFFGAFVGFGTRMGWS